MPLETVTARGYLVVEATGPGHSIRGAKVVKATSRLPLVSGGQIALALTVHLPKSLFDLNRYQVEVTVPEDGGKPVVEVTLA